MKKCEGHPSCAAFDWTPSDDTQDGCRLYQQHTQSRLGEPGSHGRLYCWKIFDAADALHVRYARAVSSVQLPISATSATADGADAFTVHTGSPFYLDIAPAQGMSGGAVVDLKCHVMGILERKSVYAPGGQYVSLEVPEVLKWLVDTAQSALG